MAIQLDHHAWRSQARDDKHVFISSPDLSAAPAPDRKETRLARVERGILALEVFCPARQAIHRRIIGALWSPFSSLVLEAVHPSVVASPRKRFRPRSRRILIFVHPPGRRGQTTHQTMSKINRPASNKKKDAAKRIRPVTRPDAAGIDLAALVHYVAVPPDRDPQPVQSFGTQTADLHKLADWLVACRIKTVAMEATGVYWVPLYQILEDRGLEVCLVNARHAKNVPGRKTDVLDCEWLQYLHSVGLLNASFRPPAPICAVRALVRHRDSLVQTGCEHLLRIQKALDQMNVQVHHAVSDITGMTGLAILEAILNGERDPQKLAQLRDPRCKKTQSEIAAALHGDWRPEHLFTLRQSLAAWRYHQTLITECEAELKKQMDTLADQTKDAVPAKAKPDQRCDETLRHHLFRKFGVDLTTADGMNTQTALVLLSEVGTDLSKFATADHFASWLCLSPDNRVSGGRRLSVATRTGANRLATALRLAARSLHRSQTALGDWYRRMKAKLGSAGAITATAHKLARILWAMIKHRRPFDPARLGNPELRQQRRENALRRAAKELGYLLQPIHPVPVS